MHCPLRTAAVLLAGALVLGCGDQPGPAEPASAAIPSPDFDGSTVIHDEQGAFVFLDPETGLSGVIGWTFAELELFCTTGEITIGALQEVLVFRPDESLHQQLHGAQIPLEVWQSPSPDLCAVLDEPHLTGSGQFMLTDSDVFVSGNRTDAAHLSLHGQVTSETGERFQALWNFHAKIQKGSSEQINRSDFRLI